MERSISSCVALGFWKIVTSPGISNAFHTPYFRHGWCSSSSTGSVDNSDHCNFGSVCGSVCIGCSSHGTKFLKSFFTFVCLELDLGIVTASLSLVSINVLPTLKSPSTRRELGDVRSILTATSLHDSSCSVVLDSALPPNHHTCTLLEVGRYQDRTERINTLEESFVFDRKYGNFYRP